MTEHPIPDLKDVNSLLNMENQKQQTGESGIIIFYLRVIKEKLQQLCRKRTVKNYQALQKILNKLRTDYNDIHDILMQSAKIRQLIIEMEKQWQEDNHNKHELLLKRMEIEWWKEQEQPPEYRHTPYWATQS